MVNKHVLNNHFKTLLHEQTVLVSSRNMDRQRCCTNVEQTLLVSSRNMDRQRCCMNRLC